VSTVRQLTAHDIPSLVGGRVPSEIFGGFVTPDISAFAQFSWYEYIWFYDPMVLFPEDARKLARWIEVTQDVAGQSKKSKRI
jgi:hypothetical protein